MFLAGYCFSDSPLLGIAVSCSHLHAMLSVVPCYTTFAFHDLIISPSHALPILFMIQLSQYTTIWYRLAGRRTAMKEVGVPTGSALNRRLKHPLYYTLAPTAVPKGSHRIRERDRGSEDLR